MAIERLQVANSCFRESGISHLQRYLFAQPRVHGRILDVACGVGFGTYLLGGSAEHVVGVDLSADAIEEAKAQHTRDNLTYHLGTLDSLPPTAPFDAAVSLETIEHVPDPIGFLKSVHARLKPGGTLVISAPNTLQHQRGTPPVPNPYHLNEPTYSDLRTWVSNHFNITEEWEQSRTVAPRHDATEPLARAGATLGQYRVVRFLVAIERGLRRLTGKDLPPVAPVIRYTDELIADTTLLPLLPARRDLAHTFLFVARAKP